MLGHHGDASETPFKWRFAGEAMMAQNITTNKQNQLKITKETLISIFGCSCVRLLVHRFTFSIKKRITGKWYTYLL